MTDRERIIVESYNRLSSVWKVGEEIGLSGQTVHEILTRLGKIHKMNYFSKEDENFLLEHYAEYRETNRLQELANIMGRTKQFLCRRAKKLGLTDVSNKPKLTDEEKQRISVNMKQYLSTHPHPKGYSGHKHSIEAKRKISASSKRAWDDPNSQFNSEAFKQKQSDRMFQSRINGKIKPKSNRKEIISKIGGKEYHFLSSWEYEIAIRLDELKNKSFITDWEYEPERFIFKDVKRGIRSYLPDFKIIRNDGILYLEVKGWQMPNGMKRIAMFRERFQEKKLLIIDENEYKSIISQTDHLWRRTQQI